MATPSAPERSRLALLVLALAVGWVIRTSGYSVEDIGPRQGLQQCALVLVISVAFLVIWLNHGLIPATIATVVVLSARESTVNDTLTKRWIFDEILFLAAFGVVTLTWSELGRHRFTPSYWILASLAGTTIVAAVCIHASQTSDLLADGVAASPAKESLQRAQQLTVALYIFGGLLGAWQALKRRTCPRSAVAAAAAMSLLAPALAFTGARLSVGSTLGDLLNGADWAGFAGEFWNWVGQGGYQHAVSDAIHGAVEPLLLPLMVVGLWRAVARGYRQKRRGQISLAWPVAFGTGTALLLVPLAAATTRSLGLVFAVAVLPVFGVSDLVQAVADRMILRGPDDQR